MKNLSTRATAIYTLYKAKRINLDGMKKAVRDKVITADEFQQITGKEYK